MRIEAAGAQITAAMVSVLESLQTDSVTFDNYAGTIDRVMVKLITTSDDNGDDPADTLALLHALTLLRNDLVTLFSPPDIDDEDNDIPVFSI